MRLCNQVDDLLEMPSTYKSLENLHDQHNDLGQVVNLSKVHHLIKELYNDQITSLGYFTISFSKYIFGKCKLF